MKHFYEYNDLNQLICGKSYNKEGGYLSYQFTMFYDQYGNWVEQIASSFHRDQSQGITGKFTYEYEYFDVKK